MFITRSSNSARSIASGFMMGVTKLYFEKSKHLDLVAQLLEQRREGPGRVHRPVGEIGLPVPRHAIGFFQRLRRLVVETDDELRFGEMSASRRRRMASLFCATFVSLLKRSSFSCAAASVPRLT